MPVDFIRTVAEDGVVGGRVCLPEATEKPELARAAVATANKGGGDPGKRRGNRQGRASWKDEGEGDTSPFSRGWPQPLICKMGRSVQ